MLRRRGALMVAAILAGMIWPHPLTAQIEEATAEQTQEEPSSSQAKPSLPSVPSRPWLPDVPPPITPPPPPMPSTQALLIDRPDQRLGWFAIGDIDIVKPHFSGFLTSGVPITPTFSTVGTGQFLTLPALNSGVSGELTAPTFPNAVQLPMANMHWTVIPEIFLGYRFDKGAGALRLHYLNATSEGSQVLPNYDLAGSGFLRSHLNLNVADLDYVSSEFIFRPNRFLLQRELQGFLGLRTVSFFFDSTASGQQILDQHITNETAGLGLHVGWNGWQALPVSGLSLFTRLDAAGVWVTTRQRYTETAMLPDGSVITGNASSSPLSNGLANLVIEGGLSWTPDTSCRNVRFTLGYVWMHWWNAGHTDTSTADLNLQGVLLRGEWAY
jgi:hypothetical protein